MKSSSSSTHPHADGNFGSSVVDHRTFDTELEAAASQSELIITGEVREGGCVPKHPQTEKQAAHIKKHLQRKKYIRNSDLSIYVPIYVR